MSSNSGLYSYLDLDFFYDSRLQEILTVITKYLRKHVCLWKYPHYGVSEHEITTAISSISLTQDEIRVGIHILKHSCSRGVHMSRGHIRRYLESLIEYVCEEFVGMYVLDELVDHLPVDILMSYTQIERVTACRCLEYIRNLYRKYPSERSFPYHSLLTEAYLVDRSKISDYNYETIRQAIDPKCKNFYVNMLFSIIVHVSHNQEDSPRVPCVLKKETIGEFFNSVHLQFLLAVVDCNTTYKFEERVATGKPTPMSSLGWSPLSSYRSMIEYCIESKNVNTSTDTMDFDKEQYELLVPNPQFTPFNLPKGWTRTKLGV